MAQQNPLSLVRALKGAPLSCLIALTLIHQPTTARWLSAVTGYSDKTVTTALALLEELQLANCNASRSAWQLTAGAVQLPLAMDRNFYDPAPATTTAIVETPESAQLQLTDRNFYDPNLAAFAVYGVGSSTALAELCQRPDLTPAYIHAQAARLRAENRLSPALLFHVCRSGDPLPKTNRDDNKYKSCPDCYGPWLRDLGQYSHNRYCISRETETT